MYAIRSYYVGAQHAAPRLSEDVIARRDSEVTQEVVEFVQEKLNRPEIGALVGQVGRLTVAQLVVVDNGAALLGDVLEGINIVVGAAGPAV